MTRHCLVIDQKDQGPFFLLIEGGTVTIGGSRKDAATVLQHLRVARIHCELEVEGDAITLRDDSPGHSETAHPLQSGEMHTASAARFHLEAAAEKSLDEAPSEASASGPAAEQPRMQKRLLVIDGADQGRSFPLPASGVLTLGKDRKYVDILLHDLHVSRINCQLEIDGDHVVVVHQAGVSGTLINGEKVTRQDLLCGDVLRVGNSHLRLEVVLAGEEFAKVSGSAEEDDEESILGIATDSGGSEREAPEEEPAPQAVRAEESETEPVPEDAPESVRLLHVLRDKLPQLSGHTFGHYRLGPVLGRGRYGVVFQADHLESGQVAALKVFSPLFPHGDQELSRFARVMKGVLPLRHPHLVALNGAGKTGTYTWVAREYVQGESLKDLIGRLGKGQRLDWRLGLRVAGQVGRALDFARKHHVRHGKILPANILVQRSDKNVKLADLMLGAALEGSRLWLAGLEHRPLGDLAYLSPEQTAVGAFVDELSDLYSLGAIVFTLLTGRPPFQGNTADDLLHQIQGPAKPPRPGGLNASIPAALEKVVLKMLAKRQEDRYQTPAELLAELAPVEGSLGT